MDTIYRWPFIYMWRHLPAATLTKRQVVGLFLSLQFRWNFICLHVLNETSMIPFFRKWPLSGLNKQSWCWKIFFDWHSYLTQPHNVKWLISFIITILLKFHSPPCFFALVLFTFVFFCIFSCKRFSDIAKKYVWALNVLTGKLNFIME